MWIGPGRVGRAEAAVPETLRSCREIARRPLAGSVTLGLVTIGWILLGLAAVLIQE
jgi:hypothetical protein